MSAPEHGLPEPFSSLVRSGRRRLDDGLLVVALLAALTVAWKFVDYAYDDAYITFRYARHIVEGNGFVYNLEHNYLGTTTPLYTLLLAALGLVFEIPLAAGLLSIVSLLGCIVLVEAIGRDAGVRLAGPAAALFLVPSTQVYGIFGGETLFVWLLLLPLGLWLDRRGSIMNGPERSADGLERSADGRRRSSPGRGYRLGAAVVFGLSMLARMDAAVFVGVVYAERTARERRLPLAEGATIGLTLLPWMLYAWATFGSPFPSTLWAKIAQGASGGWRLYLDGAHRELAQLPEYADGLAWVFAPVLLLGLVRIARRERVWAVFVASSVLFAIAYQAVLRVAFSHWYLANVYVANAIVLGAGLREAVAIGGALAGRLRPGEAARRAGAIGVAAALAVAVGMQQYRGLSEVAAFDTMGPRRTIYTRLGRWLAEHTAPEATVAYYEIGYVGWFSRRTILDPVGLVTPGGLEAIRAGRLHWIFEQYEPDYYVHSTHLGGRGIVASPAFRRHYYPVHRFEERGYASDLIVYRRRTGEGM